MQVGRAQSDLPCLRQGYQAGFCPTRYTMLPLPSSCFSHSSSSIAHHPAPTVAHKFTGGNRQNEALSRTRNFEEGRAASGGQLSLLNTSMSDRPLFKLISSWRVLVWVELSGTSHNGSRSTQVAVSSNDAPRSVTGCHKKRRRQQLVYRAYGRRVFSIRRHQYPSSKQQGFIITRNKIEL